MSKFKVGDFVKVAGTDMYGVVSLVYHDVYPTDDIEFVLDGKCYQVDVGDRYCRDVMESDLEPASREDFRFKSDDELEPETSKDYESELEKKIIRTIRSRPQTVVDVVKKVGTSRAKAELARTIVRRLVDAGKLKLDGDWKLVVDTAFMDIYR